MFFSVMLKDLLRATFLCCLAVLLGSCRGGDEVSRGAQPGSAETQAAAPPSETRAPGDYCFFHEDETLTLTIELTVGEEDRVTGVQAGIIEDAQEGYYSSYESSIIGELAGDTLTLTLVTEIEDDTQEEHATWTWEGDTLTDGVRVFELVSCGGAG